MRQYASVVVIGGGPAGSTAAALLARAGIDVVLLERDQFPRYHIGESLLLSCPEVLELSGARARVDAAGFTDKFGGLFRWGDEEDWVVDWFDIYGPGKQGWQVDRGQFDKVLLDNARAQGVEVHEGAQVHEVVFDKGRPIAVRWSTRTDTTRRLSVECDHVIDASGRAGVLSARHFRNREHHKIFRNVAVWAYWRGGDTLPGTPKGGLNSISAPHGWYWLIPLSDGRKSAGFVTHQDNFRRRRTEFSSTDTMVQALMSESDTVSSLLRGADFIPPARVEQDYSYAADRFCGPGYFLSGDAACFLDPLLATGVHLAMYSALVASACIVAQHDGTVSENEALDFYEYCYRRSYARLLTLVSAMYEQYRGKRTYFWTAHRLTRGDTGQPSDTAFARDFADLSTGLGDLIEATGTDHRQVMTAKLITEAHRTQAQALALGRSPSSVPLDFSVAYWDPHGTQEPSEGLVLVTSPRLGLAKSPTADPPKDNQP
jgi:flavin-dependent dehydrogenase